MSDRQRLSMPEREIIYKENKVYQGQLSDGSALKRKILTEDILRDNKSKVLHGSTRFGTFQCGFWRHGSKCTGHDEILEQTKV